MNIQECFISSTVALRCVSHRRRPINKEAINQIKHAKPVCRDRKSSADLSVDDIDKMDLLVALNTAFVILLEFLKTI